MAIVYKAFDTRLETNVAIKVIRTEQLAPSLLAHSRKRFEREAKSLAGLTHPNIAKVTDYGEYDGQPFLVMEYIPGGTLKRLLTGSPMPWQEAARLLLPVARALEYAHQHGIVHRDVKPSNILITESGEPMLSDFGVAKILDDAATVDLTVTGAAVGTPEYMAPEQVTSKLVDHRADIYSLGIIFYEMITGRKPYRADTPLAVLVKHASEPLPRPKQFVPDLPDRVEEVLLKALTKQPNDRYQNMGELILALEDIAHNKVLPVKMRKKPVRDVYRPETTVVTGPPVSQLFPSKGVNVYILTAIIMFGLSVIGAIIVGAFFLLQKIDTHPTVSQSQRPEDRGAVSPSAPTDTQLPTVELPTETPYIPPTAVPTDTPRPQPTNPPQPLSPMFTASEPMFCREGPGTQYDPPWQLNAGDRVPVIGYWYRDSSWLLVDINDSRTRTDCCWVRGNGSLNVNRDQLNPISTIPDRMNCSSVR